MKKEDVPRHLVTDLVRDIFGVFARRDAPLGAAAMAATICVVQIARSAGVDAGELIRSVTEVWKSQEREASQQN